MAVKALVVDDSRIMRNMVIRGLNRSKLAEFEFVEAGDSAGALHAFDEGPIDIALLDWDLPGTSGVEIARQIRARQNTRHVPLVMVTSEESVEKIEEALDSAGANCFIRKPVDDAQIEEKLRRLVEGIVALKSRKGQSHGGWFWRVFS